MNTRIRYTHVGNGVYQSVNTFNSLLVKLDHNNLTYSIVNIETGAIVVSGGESSIALLKSRAKSDLKELGVIFASETRTVTTGRSVSATMSSSVSR